MYRIFFVALLIINLYGYVFAGSKAEVKVSATVLPRVSFVVLYQSIKINVTEEDRKKGYVEIPSGTIFKIQSNSKNGYAVYFEGDTDFFKEIWVIRGSRITILSPCGGFVYEPYGGKEPEIKEVSYRFFLSENTPVGSYLFPFRLRPFLF
ncbi:MAG: hypothetical protein Q6367_012720 [Candidatus Freyarchaeota archaeon]